MRGRCVESLGHLCHLAEHMMMMMSLSQPTVWFPTDRHLHCSPQTSHCTYITSVKLEGMPQLQDTLALQNYCDHSFLNNQIFVGFFSGFWTVVSGFWLLVLGASISIFICRETEEKYLFLWSQVCCDWNSYILRNTIQTNFVSQIQIANHCLFTCF